MAAPRNDNVKEKILDAATGLLDTQTFADISLAEIAAAAGVSKGTLYYYYKNKTDILFDLTNRYLDRQWDELIAWTGNKDKDTSVHRLVKYVVERNTASAGMRLHLIHAAMLGDEALRAKLIDRYAAFERLIAEKIAEPGTDAFYLPSFDDIENYLLKNCKKNDLLITMGAGNVYSIGNDLIKN